MRALGLSLEVTPAFLINSDEEVGSPETTEAISRLARHADRALVLEPALGPSGKLKTARKSGGHVLIEVSGVSAHAGLEPEKGVSAVVELSRLVQELHAMNDPERGISINVGTIRGGDRANVVADRCEAEVDVRVEHAEHMEQIREKIEELRTDHENAEIEITARVGRPPMEFTERNRALWERAREAGEAIGIDLDHDLAGGSSDGNTASRFAATLDVLGAKMSGAGRYRDILSIQDAGADVVIDFVDGGVPSTVCSEQRYDETLRYLLNRMAGTDADVGVIEIGASPLEPYNGERAIRALLDQIKCTVLSASDPYAVVGVMKAFDMKPDLVAGLATSTEAGIHLVDELTGIPALNVLDPASRDPLRRLLARTLEHPELEPA